MTRYEVSSLWAGNRLDQFLAAQHPEHSRTTMRQWLAEGRVLVNGQQRKASFALAEGQSVQVDAPENEAPSELTPENIPLSIVYEDETLLIIDKAAGMVVHPGSGVRSGTLAHALLHHFQQLSRLGGPQRPGILHRLDKGTTGLILVAKNDPAHLNLSAQWQAGDVTKVYQALVWGAPNEDHCEVESHIGRHPTDRKRMAAEVPGGRYAHSRFKVVERYQEAARVNAHILTGRTHQIRVHLAQLGHPVVGDALYGGKIHRGLRASFPAMPDHPMLHAGLLRFRHPLSGEPMSFKLEPPAAFQACAAALAHWPA